MRGLQGICNVGSMLNVLFKTKSMRHLRFALITLFTLAVAKASAEDGWIELFNGKDLSGWTQKGGKAKYSVDGDAILGETVAGTPNSFLCTDKNYDNFILELDFKVDPRLNSGVQIRSECFDKPTQLEWNGKTIKIEAGRVHGYQSEIDPDAARKRMWTAGIYDEARRLWLYPGQLGGESNQFSRQGLVIFNTNNWNHLRVVADGPTIKTYLNNVLCAHIEDSMTPKGFIGLQVHSVAKDPANNGIQVRFKNIRLKEITPTPKKSEPVPNTLTGQEKKDGWRLLWDGKTTDGWRSPKSEKFPQKGWSVDDGVLTVHENNGAESIAGGDIITRERFSSFELVADFKLTPGANSGIKYFVQPNIAPIDKVTGQPTAAGSAIGCEFQVLDDARHPDAKLGKDGDRTIASLYDLMPASTSKKPNPIGEWNTARIVVRGKHVEHWLNGEKVLEYDRGSADFRKHVAESKFKNIPSFGEWADGHILLQEHGNEVSFRNVKLRVLSDK
jgi:hypothetical protein